MVLIQVLDFKVNIVFIFVFLGCILHNTKKLFADKSGSCDICHLISPLGYAHGR